MSDRHFRGWLLDNPLRRILFPPSRFIDGKVAAGMVVADLGSGPGYLSIPLAEATGPTGRVFAVDTDEKAIARVKTKAEARGLTHLDGRVSSASDVRFIQDASVDVLYGKGLLCCTADHAGALREIRRVLRKGGAAYLSVRKGGPKTDPRRVDKSEWSQILAGFSVERRGEGLTNRWAWVTTDGQADRSGPALTER
jgi:ubiquinone/menaquinone biosynthesis C-methylase UbiE